MKKVKKSEKKNNLFLFFFSFAVIVRNGIFTSVPICQSPQGRTKGSRIFGSRGTLPTIHCHCRSVKYRYKSRWPQKSFQTSWGIPTVFIRLRIKNVWLARLITYNPLPLPIVEIQIFCYRSHLLFQWEFFRNSWIILV